MTKEEKKAKDARYYKENKVKIQKRNHLRRQEAQEKAERWGKAQVERDRILTKDTLIREGDKRVIEDLNMAGIGVALNKFFEQPSFDYTLRNDRDPYPNMHQGSE